MCYFNEPYFAYNAKTSSFYVFLAIDYENTYKSL